MVVACSMYRDIRTAYKILVGEPGGRDDWEVSELDGGIMLKLILRKQVWMVWTRFIWIKIDTDVGL
jgi:hypothetical protein